MENLKWLNTTNALADIAYFIQSINVTEPDITTTKWVVIGGSYPGGMAAEFRHLYPGVASAAWSSAGTLLSKEYYNEFDMSIYLSAKQSRNGCPKNFAMILTDIERILTWGNQTQKQEIYTIFANENPDIDHADFLLFVSDIFALAIQYGRRTEICDYIVNITDKTLTPNPFQVL